MVNRGVAGTLVAEIPWGASGLPEEVVEAPRDSRSWAAPPQRVRGTVGVRLVDGGELQVSIIGSQRVHAVKLGSARQLLDYASPHRILDAYLMRTGESALLESTDNITADVVRLAPTGLEIARLPAVMPLAQRPRLVGANGSELFIGGTGALLRVSDHEALTIATWDGGEPIGGGNGTIAYVTFDRDSGTRSVVRLDTAAGTSASTPASRESWPLLTNPIGMDASGRIYGSSAGLLGRVGVDGSVEWLIELDALEARGDGSVAINRGQDARSLPQPGVDDSLTRDVVRAPGFASVLPGGSVATPVVGPRGVRVMELSPALG